MRFLTNESGALTTDWVVLAASVVGLGMATVGTVRGGMNALGSDVQTSLSNVYILSNETQQKFSELYFAYMEYMRWNPNVGANWTEEGFYGFVDFLYAAPGTELATWLRDGVATSTDHAARVALLDTMIGQGLTDAEAMAMLGIPPTGWRGRRNTLGPDVDATLRQRRAESQYQVAGQNAMTLIAAEGGVSW